MNKTYKHLKKKLINILTEINIHTQANRRLFSSRKRWYIHTQANSRLFSSRKRWYFVGNVDNSHRKWWLLDIYPTLTRHLLDKSPTWHYSCVSQTTKLYPLCINWICANHAPIQDRCGQPTHLFKRINERSRYTSPFWATRLFYQRAFEMHNSILGNAPIQAYQRAFEMHHSI